MVLWGKSKDQLGSKSFSKKKKLGSKSDNEKIIPTAKNVATIDERIMTSNQEFMTINVTNLNLQMGLLEKSGYCTLMLIYSWNWFLPCGKSFTLY